MTSSVGLLAIMPPSINCPEVRKYVGAAPVLLALFQIGCSEKNVHFKHIV